MVIGGKGVGLSAVGCTGHRSLRLLIMNGNMWEFEGNKLLTKLVTMMTIVKLYKRQSQNVQVSMLNRCSSIDN